MVGLIVGVDPQRDTAAADFQFVRCSEARNGSAELARLNPFFAHQASNLLSRRLGVSVQRMRAPKCVDRASASSIKLRIQTVSAAAPTNVRMTPMTRPLVDPFVYAKLQIPAQVIITNGQSIVR